MANDAPSGWGSMVGNHIELRIWKFISAILYAFV